ncbi:D-alanyl-D-alanine carboxypeptidase [Candidatus Woesebacteria bacterium]|nr:D-alanyl-D-alanine carboxypeptidase [Candidatus Woesebacteria bacterium]
MKQKYFFILVIATLAGLFYPGNHYLYNLELNNPDSFAQPLPLPTLAHPIPAVKEGVKDPRVTAEGVYIVERKTFTIVYEKNPDKRFYPASTTKIVTALTTTDLMKAQDVLTVHTATSEGQLMNLVPEERMTVENLLYGMLVYSANDAAYALANYREDYPAFIDHMNIIAQRIGMKNSTFRNPAGLDEEGQLTTPHDLALAARTLLDDPSLRKMVSIQEITVMDEDFRISHPLTNINTLLGNIEGLGGIKTGYTEAAGENLVSYFKTPYTGHEYIIVVMKSQDRFADTQSLTEWITFNIEYLEP